MPRQLTYNGSRLVYLRVIVALPLIACLLVIVFKASVMALIPLYAIGVFLSFTLSQAGMARRLWRVGNLKPAEEIVDPGSTLPYLLLSISLFPSDYRVTGAVRAYTALTPG